MQLKKLIREIAEKELIDAEDLKEEHIIELDLDELDATSSEIKPI